MPYAGLAIVDLEGSDGSDMRLRILAFDGNCAGSDQHCANSSGPISAMGHPTPWLIGAAFTWAPIKSFAHRA